MKPLEINPLLIKPADDEIDGPKILQRADLVWSKMELKQGEYLLIKIPRHMVNYTKDISELVDHVFKRDADRVLLFVEGDIEITKVTKA